jgi:hypothetical protein
MESNPYHAIVVLNISGKPIESHKQSLELTENRFFPSSLTGDKIVVKSNTDTFPHFFGKFSIETNGESIGLIPNVDPYADPKKEGVCLMPSSDLKATKDSLFCVESFSPEANFTVELFKQ